MGIRWIDDRAAVIAAEQELLRRRTVHREQTLWLRDRMQRHRAALLVSSGLCAGLLVGWLPLRSWSRTGAAAVSAGFAIARTPLGPLLFGALFARRADVEVAPAPSVEDR